MFDIHSITESAFAMSVNGDQFRFVDLNAECLRRTGIPAELQLGKSPTERFGSRLADRLEAKYRLCAQSREPICYEIESVVRGSYTCWRTTLVPVVSPDTGAVAKLIGICMDATGDKITERSKTAFHDTLSLAIGRLDGGFWVYDVAEAVFETSRPLSELVGGPGHATMNLAEYANYIFAEDLIPGTLLQSEGSSDYRVITHDGRTRWLNSTRRQIRDTQGVVTHVVGLVIDVTDETDKRQTLTD